MVVDDTLPPRLIPLARIQGEPVGGKAVQLAALLRLGLRVPEGFVIVGAAPGRLPPELDQCAAQLGGPVAVRSSALEEDSTQASFAGQFETVLGVEGAQAIRKAVEQCLSSVDARRAQAYRSGINTQGEVRMAVVVQRMVDACAAGVIFTADPVTGRQDRVVVNAAAGLGEALVGGRRAADEYVLSRDGAVIEYKLQGERATLDDPTLGRLMREALKAESGFGYPLDLEWAIGPANEIFWLQARPITTLELPGPDELDDPVDPAWQVMSYNIAEWMPGAMPPLSWSVVGASYIRAMNDLWLRVGISRQLVESVPILVNVQGHALINMSNFYLLGAQMFGMDKESSDLTLGGQVLPRVELPPNAPFLRRLANTLRYFLLVPAGRKRLDAFVARYADFRVEPTDDLPDYYRRLEDAVAIFNESGAVHVHTSMMAIALLGLFEKLLSKGGRPTPQSQAAVAALLAGAKAGAADAAHSSIGVADSLDDLGGVITAQPGAADRFARLPENEALAWLRDTSSGQAGKAFASFLAMHGHRCIRELDFRERDWKEDPLPLVQSLQLIVSAPRATQTDWAHAARQALAGLSWPARWVIRRLLPKAHQAIVQRERSKSFSVWVARQLKRGFADFAQRLVAAGRLPDVDLVYFLTHEELGRLAQGSDRALVRRAEHRRRLHPRKMSVEFPRVCRGKPQPVADAARETQTGDAMQGTPLSRGVATGPARVVRTPQEAADMKSGEILVTPFTDVGWTPFFSRAAGLATEVGSVLSHGAVVAREYGLPAIAGLPDVTRRFKTGDMLLLNGNTGELRRLR
jgi:pyruvate,water dikinase